MSKDEIILEIWNSHQIIKYCKVVGGNNWEELRSELIGQLYNMNVNKLYKYKLNGFLEYVCFKICSRIKNGHVVNTGIFYQHNTADITWELPLLDFIDDDVYILGLYDKVLDLVDEQHWYNKTLFRHYYIDGMKLKEISEKYGINIKSIHYAIGKVKNEIKKQIEDDDNTYFWG